MRQVSAGTEDYAAAAQQIAAAAEQLNASTEEISSSASHLADAAADRRGRSVRSGCFATAPYAGPLFPITSFVFSQRLKGNNMLKIAVIGAQTLLGRSLWLPWEPQDCSVLPLATGPMTKQDEEGDLVVFAPEPALLQGLDVVILRIPPKLDRFRIIPAGF